MKHLRYQPILKGIAAIALLAGWGACLNADEPATVVAMPVSTAVATPVEDHSGLGKFVGKTMKAVAHRGKLESKDSGAPEAAPTHKLFDPKRKESPIRTARLFRIQLSGEAG